MIRLGKGCAVEIPLWLVALSESKSKSKSTLSQLLWSGRRRVFGL